MSRKTVIKRNRYVKEESGSTSGSTLLNYTNKWEYYINKGVFYKVAASGMKKKNKKQSKKGSK